MGGGWGVCLHHPWGSGHRLHDAHSQCQRIQVSPTCFLKGAHMKHTYTYGCTHYTSEWNAACLHRRPHSTDHDDESGELSRITFVFETICTANCRLYFLTVRHTCPWMHVCLDIYSLTPIIPVCEVSVFLCRVTINGTTMWWSNGMATTVSNRTPTWFKGGPSPALPGHFNEQRKPARWAWPGHTPLLGEHRTRKVKKRAQVGWSGWRCRGKSVTERAARVKGKVARW